MHLILLTATAALLTFAVAAAAASPWDPATFPDEPGFQKRIAPTLPALAAETIGGKLNATSTCPHCKASNSGSYLTGETVTCVTCDKSYPQPEGSYFGPARRDEQGRITHFKGDPLKFELQQATAKLLLKPNDQPTRDYVSIPGVLRQQYHFACVNWARFYPLLADNFDDAWKKDFAHYVAIYKEERRPSDQHKDLPPPEEHNLVGTKGEFLGGGVADGGTENHKTMWRTSGLLYAQLLPKGPAGKDAKVSNFPAAEADTLISGMLHDYLRKCLTLGSGEWQSATYYPYSIRGFLNLYDFSPDPDTRTLAHAQLDYYFAVYGIHLVNSTYAGPQKRGFVNAAPFDTNAKKDTPDEMVALFTGVPAGTGPDAGRNVVSSVHLATTRYRPNRVLTNLLTKNVPLPFEAQIAHPSYHLKDKNVAQEYLYVTDQYAMGSVYLTAQDNPTQQTIWSLAIKHKEGTAVIGGGHPKYRSPEGHSPYTQTMQHKGTILVMAGQTLPLPAGIKPAPEQHDRARNAPQLARVDGFDSTKLDAFWKDAPASAQSWLYIPREGTTHSESIPAVSGPPTSADGPRYLLIESGDTWVVAFPLTETYFTLRAPESMDKAAPYAKTLSAYDLIISTGDVSGFAIDVATKQDFPTRDALAKAIATRTALDTSKLKEGIVTYKSLAGDTLEMHYQPTGLRCTGTINNKPLDFANWANGGHIASPYLTAKDGIMKISDGKEAYEIDATGKTVTFREAKP